MGFPPGMLIPTSADGHGLLAVPAPSILSAMLALNLSQQSFTTWSWCLPLVGFCFPSQGEDSATTLAPGAAQMSAAPRCRLKAGTAHTPRIAARGDRSFTREAGDARLVHFLVWREYLEGV